MTEAHIDLRLDLPGAGPPAGPAAAAPKTQAPTAGAYRAFMSYSHAADDKLAPALQSALQGFAKPWYRLRALRIFRDKTSLSADPGLWPAIERALQASDWFLLLASPDSARSHWVEQEVLWWLAHRPADRMLIILTDGELCWDADGSDFDWNRTDALGRYLSGRIAAEPLHVDLRWAKGEEKLSLRHSKFRAAILDLAAPLQGRPKDELDGEDVRQHRRTRRMAWAAATALVLLTVVAVATAVVAVQQRETAISRQLAAESEILRGQRTDLLPTSLLVALESLRHGFSLAAVQTLQKGLQLLPAERGLVVRHGEGRTLAALTPDGRLLVTGADDGKVRVWDVASGAEKARMALGGRIFYLSMSRDGRRVVAAAFQGKVSVVFDLATGATVQRFQQPAQIDALALSPDGLELATGGGDGQLRIWDVASGRERLRLPHQGAVVALAWAPDGRLLLSGSTDNKTRLWAVDSGTEQWRFAHQQKVQTVAFSPDGLAVATGGWDFHAHVLDAMTGRALADHLRTEGIMDLVFSPDSSQLAVASLDGRAIVIRTRGGDVVASFEPEGGVDYVAFSGNGRLLATSGASSVVQVWSVLTRGETARIAAAGPAASLSFAATGNLLAVGGHGTARSLNLDSSELRHGESLLAAAFSPDGAWAAVARSPRTVTISNRYAEAPLQLALSEDADQLLLTPEGTVLLTLNRKLGVLRAWDTASRKSLWAIACPMQGIIETGRSLLSPDGRYATLGCNSQGQTLDVIAVASGRKVGRAQHDGVITAGQFNPDGSQLLTSGDKSVRLWQSNGGALLHRFDQPGQAGTARFSRDGRQILTHGGNGMAVLRVASSGVELRRFDDRANGSIRTAAFSPDGHTIAIATARGVHLWNADSGEGIALLRQNDGIDGISFSPDGRHLATASRDHAVRVWDIARREEVARQTSLGEAFDVVFDADGRFLLVWQRDNTDNFWRPWLWKPADLRSAVCARLDHNLSRDEWQRLVSSGSYQRTCPDLPEGQDLADPANGADAAAAPKS